MRSQSNVARARRIHAVLIASLAISIVAADSTIAQVATTRAVPARPGTKPAGWLGFNIEFNFTVEELPGGRTKILMAGDPVIVSVDPGSPAEVAGLVAGDVVRSLNGEKPEQGYMDEQLEDVRPGMKFTFVVRRGEEGRPRTIVVTATKPPRGWTETRNIAIMPEAIQAVGVAGRHVATPKVGPRGVIIARPREMWPPPHIAERVPGKITLAAPATTTTSAPGGAVVAIPFGVSGTTAMLMPMGALASAGGSFGILAGSELARINPALGKTLGVKSGILVIDVLPRTPAAEAGLRPGDIVQKVDGKTVFHPVMLSKAIFKAPHGRVRLTLLREGKQEMLTLTWNFEVPVTAPLEIE